MFGHNDFARDVELKPEWDKYVPQFSTNLFEYDLSNKLEVQDNYKTRVTVGASCPYGFGNW